jgi:beta-amylase
MPADAPTPSEKPVEKKSTAAALCNEVYGFAHDTAEGFYKEAIKPLVGVEQIGTGKTAAELTPKTPEQDHIGYKIGAMAGQAADFIAVQMVAKKIGWNPRAATILTSGALAALAPTESGGLSLVERSENFAVGAASMAAYEGAGAALRREGLNAGMVNGIKREAMSGMAAGFVSAQTNSLLKEHQFADAPTTFESMAGWAAAGAAFHVVGSVASRLSAEVTPEILARTGKLEATAVPDAPAGSTREFMMTSGKDALDTFKASNERGTMVQVRELLKGEDGAVNLGKKQSMLVQHLSAQEGDGRLLPLAKSADLLATCHPENLSGANAAKHVFAKGEGNVWLYAGKNNRLLLSSGDVPVNVTNVNGYKEPFKLNRGDTTIHAMAPLLVGNPNDMNSDETKAALADWRRQLAEAKKLKIDGISMDMWWGMIEKEKGTYNFDYFHALTDDVIKAGLDVAAVLSFHQCGGNVGDTESIPIPSWTWKDLADKFGTTDLNVGKYKSEQGNYSPEYIQLWADKYAMPYYAGVMNAFKTSFAAKAPFISEVNVSLGPSGEMRYPSYNSHDVGTGYPTRGALQAYSDLAKTDFRSWAIKKYGSVQGVGNAWGIKDLNADNILPPDNASSFYDMNNHLNTPYGKDLIDWYNSSLVDHGKNVLSTAQSIFGAADSPFLGTPVGAKIPGVHWRMGWIDGNNNVYFSDRKAETNAGLIQTSQPWVESNAYGYQNILNMFKGLQPLRPGTGTPIIPSYTCLELPDGQDGPDAQSLPHTAATRFGQAANALGLSLKGENALSGTLYNAYDWDLMDNEVKTPASPGRYYSGLTILRLHDIVDNPVGRDKITNLIQAIHSQPAPISPAVINSLTQTRIDNAAAAH